MRSLEFGGGLFLGAVVSLIESGWISSEPVMDRDGDGEWWLVIFSWVLTRAGSRTRVLVVRCEIQFLIGSL
jgi:hypothetical protein